MSLLKPKEISALYDTLEATQAVLASLNVPWILIAGSLLGAVRSRSILFCDDDVDIAIFEDDYERVKTTLPGALKGTGTYAVRPWPAADRIRPNAQTQVFEIFAESSSYVSPHQPFASSGLIC